LSITLVIQDNRWRKLKGLTRRMKLAAMEAIAQGGADAQAETTILLTSDRQLRALNRSFRGKDVATNVLSFPSAAGVAGYLGDVAIAYGVTVREAKNSGKASADHAIHLAVHGVLHLLGFDHMTARQARIMEPLEVSVLRTLKITNPYERRPVAS
jgi:probable rRNA maturation factor